MLYFYAFYYNSHSYGNSCIYEAARILNNAGIASRVICADGERYERALPEWVKPYYISKAAVPSHFNDEDIIFYPEIISGNPLNAKRVVRWLLNKPCALRNKPIEFQPTDLAVAFSYFVDCNLPQLFLMLDERELFSQLRKENGGHDMDTVSVYFGKIHRNVVESKNDELRRLIKKYKTVNLITSVWPTEREDTLCLIAKSDLLISYDCLSNLNYESTLLGTPVFMMDDAFDIEHKKYNVDNSGFAFSIDSIEECRKKTGNVYADYQLWLDNQERYFVSAIKSIIGFFNRIDNNSECQIENAKVIETLKKQELSEYELNHNNDRIQMIKSINQIPHSTRRIIHKEATNLVYDFSSEKIATKVEKWKKKMYQKPSGELTYIELLYLSFRSIVRKKR